jgi:hypothetical protein
MDRQRSLALGILSLRRAIATRGLDVRELERAADRALDEVPDAASWALSYVASSRPSPGPLHSSATIAITRIAAAGIAQACIDDPDALLIRTLDLAIADVETQLTRAESLERTLIPA